MRLNVLFSFPTSPEATSLVATGFKVRRYQLREALSALFELTIEVLSADPAIDMAAVVGQPVAVRFDDEPFLKELRGVVRHAAQLTAVPSGDSKYEWIIVPPLWFTTRRRDTRIFQDLTVAEIVALVLGNPAYAGRIPQAVEQLAGNEAMREYCVQYGETDHDFIFRLLAEDGIASCFDHANGSAFTLIANTVTASDLVGAPVPFSDPANLNPLVATDPEAPRIAAVTFAAGVTTSATTIRSWDFERPALVLEERFAAPGASLLPNEGVLETYTFEPGVIDGSPATGQRAAERLQSLRAPARTLVCEASFALPPGSRFTLADHPRADLNVDLLVIATSSVEEFGGASTRTLTCIDRHALYIPAQRPKPRIHGTQSAIVVGAPGEEIDVDTFGRVQVEFHWDRRALHTGGTSRRVRVAQGWAGAAFGLVMLPRVNEEVLVVYLDGDPDEPIIVGRVHNAATISPLQLPAEKTVSVWRSKSSPGGEGFNEIRMDDLAGAERLSLHAQRDYQTDVGRNASTKVTEDQTLEVGGQQTTVVKRSQTLAIVENQTTRVGQTTQIEAKTVSFEGTEAILAHAPTIMLFNGVSNVMIDGNINLVSPRIMLTAGSSSIEMVHGEIVIKADIIKLNP
jgi:type VI secretion system secreted protein VgrG